MKAITPDILFCPQDLKRTERSSSSDTYDIVQEQAVRLAGWAEATTFSVVDLYLQDPTPNYSDWQRITPAESGRLGSTTVTLL